MSIVKFIVDGMLSIADSSVEARNYHNPQSGGFNRDRANLTGDMKTVGTDMRKVMTRHGKPYKRTVAF